MQDVDETVLSYAEIKAIATGNPFIKEKMTLENDLSRIQIAKSAYLSQQQHLQNLMHRDYPAQIREKKEALDRLLDDQQRMEEHTQRMIELYRERYEYYSHGSADQAIVGLSGQIFMRKNSQDARREFRPFFDSAPVYGSGPSMEDFMEQTPLTVGSPQEVIEKTLSFRDYAGDYQRQMFLIDMRSGVKDRAGIARSVG